MSESEGDNGGFVPVTVLPIPRSLALLTAQAMVEVSNGDPITMADAEVIVSSIFERRTINVSADVIAQQWSEQTGAYTVGTPVFHNGHGKGVIEASLQCPVDSPYVWVVFESGPPRAVLKNDIVPLEVEQVQTDNQPQGG